MARFGDQLQSTLEKLAAGQRVPTSELNQLRLDGNNLSAAASNFATWSTPDGNIDPNIFAQHSRGFSAGPIEGTKLQSAVTTIPTGSVTPITWGTQPFQHGANFGWSSGAPTKLRTTAARGRDVLFVGNAVFATNSSGYRNLNLSEYDGSDVLVGGVTLAQIPAVSGTQTVLAFATVKEIHAGDSAYFVLNALQNSGGDLDVTYAELSAFILW